jgi:CheY-like chemotaxis protein
MAKLMLVEDDNNLREIYGARLMAEGYEIVSAADGEEALALAVKEKPDLIISDVMMPKISGFDMLDILRTTPETKDTKVIMMTALSQPEDRQRGEALGANKYLVKSQVTLEDVVAAVHEILEDGPANNNVNETLSSASAMPPPSPVVPPIAPIPEPGLQVEPSPSPDSAPTPIDKDANSTIANSEYDPSSQSPSNTDSMPVEEPESVTSPEPASDSSSIPETNHETESAIESTTGENVVQSQSPTNEDSEASDEFLGEEPPKVEGADDAPEPASRKKKIIAPLNDLRKEKDHLMELLAEEEDEGIGVPETGAPPLPETKPIVENLPEPVKPMDQVFTPELVQAPNTKTPAIQNPELNGLAKEKSELDEQVKELLKSGVIDEEANAEPLKDDEVYKLDNAKITSSKLKSKETKLPPTINNIPPDKPTLPAEPESLVATPLDVNASEVVDGKDDTKHKLETIALNKTTPGTTSQPSDEIGLPTAQQPEPTESIQPPTKILVTSEETPEDTDNQTDFHSIAL